MSGIFDHLQPLLFEGSTLEMFRCVAAVASSDYYVVFEGNKLVISAHRNQRESDRYCKASMILSPPMVLDRNSGKLQQTQ